MLEREYVEFPLNDGKKGFSVAFKDEKYILLSTFLYVEVNDFEDRIKEEFEQVLSGKLNYNEGGGNVCSWKITAETTKVFDQLADDGMGEWCEVDTKELYQIIVEYAEKNRAFKAKYRNR